MKPPTPIKERLLAKLRPVKSGCWEWTGSLRKSGYGRITVPTGKMGGRNHSVHRLSWEIFNGPIPEGLWVLHHCDNKICGNPAHLFLGTCKDNVQDCIRKGKMPIRRGEKCPAAKLRESDVVKIRRLLADGKRQTDIAEHYRLDPSTISRIATGKNWRSLQW